ncbi:MAG: translation initiation factor IF-2 [Peptococcaceae bacterium]|nr:translation initiation factor IF-2 [Peptococcaceae bacterium]MBP3624986.1 translation initiation factor IF-2 [Peptococcaceae bacterium]
MSKARVYEIAKELNVDSKLVIEKLKGMNVEVKNHMSSVSEEDTAKVKQAFQKPEKKVEKPVEKKPADKPEQKSSEQKAPEQRLQDQKKPRNDFNKNDSGKKEFNKEFNGQNRNQNFNKDNHNKDREHGNRDMQQKNGQRPQGNQAKPFVQDKNDNRREGGYNKDRNNDRNNDNRNSNRDFNRDNNRPNREGGYNKERNNDRNNENRNDRPNREGGYNRDGKGDFKGQKRDGQDNRGGYNKDRNNDNRNFNRDNRGGKDGYNKDRNDRGNRDNRDGGFGKGGQQQDTVTNRRVGVNANRAVPSAPVRTPIAKSNPNAKVTNEHFSKDAVEERYQEWTNNDTVQSKPEPVSKKRSENSGFQSNSSKFNKNKGGKGKNNKNMPKEPPREFAEVKHHVVLEDTITVQDLAHQMGKKATDVIMKLMGMGVMATINQELDVDTATIIAEEFGATVEVKISKEEELFTDIEDKPEDLQHRPPVVTIMGHVDHGKTSLLDKIRSTHVTSTEAGGITQHIGAYQVEISGQKITFLDTPGHEAFTAMRARGAQVTDIAILVVAADDGVMPQTIEAIDHAKAAGVPIIVAINKIDKPEADPDRIKQELTNYGLISEEWGGDTIMVPVSAKKGMGIEELLEMILLVAEVAELKANPNRNAKGKVIESKLDKGRGAVATLLVQAGTLHVGDFLIVGTTQGRIRAMFDYKGQAVKVAGPSTPVEILGLNEVPEAGDDYIAVDNEKLAKQVADKRQKEKHLQEISRNTKVSLEDLFAQIKEGDIKELNIILKADVQGSIEAIRQSLEKLGNDEVRVNIIRTAVGGIREADVMLAAASNALIIGFNVRPDVGARKMAEKESIQINTYRVIYEAIEDVKAALSGMLDPDIKEVELGQAEVRSTFKVPKVGLVAGCYVTEGKITRNARVRVVRDGVVIHDGNLGSLKRFKDDVKEVATGYECGLGFERFNDIKEGDILEAYTFEEVKRAL